jgi:signal transduction histidine kinase
MDTALEKELAFYKHQLNELTADLINRDYQMAEMSHEIRQMQRGFALIAGLNRYVPGKEMNEVFDYMTEQVNVQMQMDLTLVLQPVDNMPGLYAPACIKGVSCADAAFIAQQQVNIPHTYIYQKQSLLVTGESKPCSFTELMIRRFLHPYFIITPVVAGEKVIAFLYAARKIETRVLAASRLLLHDVHALEAIAGVIAAIKNQQEQFQLIQQERTRISAEMHDDIGAEVTRIKLFTHALNAALPEGSDEKRKLQQISGAAGKMIQTINEIVWTMNSRNDTLSNLAAYTRRYAAEYLETHNLTCTINFPDDVPSLTIPNNTRRNLFLVFKEALHNVVKHAMATHVTIDLNYAGSVLAVSIKDDGKGKNDKAVLGNGIGNMKHRMAECGGNFTLSSTEGEGTEIVMTIQLDNEMPAEATIQNTTLV